MLKKLSRLSAVSIFIVLSSCAPRMVEAPPYTGSLRDFIMERSSIETIQAEMSLNIERQEGSISGDAFLALDGKTLALRVYSMGFLTAELYEEEGLIRSNPQIAPSREAAVVDGLRNSLLWWSIKDYMVEETEEEYILRNSWKRLAIDKKTMIPKSQKIELPDGRLNVHYGRPKNSDGIWYPSEIKIEFQRYAVSLNIREIAFKR